MADLEHDYTVQHRFPHRLLLGLLLVAVVAVWVVLPDAEKVLDRMVQDDLPARGVSTLEKVRADHRRSSPSKLERLAQIWLGRHALPKENGPEPLDLLAEAKALVEEGMRDPRLGREVAELLPRVTQPDSQDKVFPFWLEDARVSPEFRDILLARVPAAALARNNPRAAALALEHLWKRGEADQAEQAIAAARAWAWAQDPARAAQMIAKQWPDFMLLIETKPELAREQIGWLRASRQATEALRLLKIWRSVPGADEDPALFEAFLEVALGESLHADAMQAARAWWKQHPDDAGHIPLLLNTAIQCGQLDFALTIAEAGRRLQVAQNDDFRLQLARLYEWTGRAGEAFDEYLVLARNGDETAVQRLIILNPGLYRDADLVGIFEARAGRLNTSESWWQYAARLVGAGQYDEAIAAYNKAIELSPGDPQMHTDLALLQRELGQLDEAAFHFAKADELSGGRADMRLYLARTEYLRGRFSEAHALFKEMVLSAPTEENLEGYIGLSEMLGDLSGWVKGRQMLLTLKGTLPLADFQRLAYGFQLLGDVRSRIEVLRQALVEFSEVDGIRSELAYGLMNENRGIEALSLFETVTWDATHSVLITAYLDLLERLGKTDEMMAFLKLPSVREVVLADTLAARAAARAYAKAGQDKPAYQLLQHIAEIEGAAPDVLVLQAQIALRLGDKAAAMKAVELLSVIQTEDALRTAAALCVELGWLPRAEQLQSQLIALQPTPRFEDVGFLGDIRDLRGDKRAAKSTYRNAIDTFWRVPITAQGVPANEVMSP
jgi:tetratricopeptide (TPR) repeat protein